MQRQLPSKKKVPFPINDKFYAYLKDFNRIAKLPLDYEDLKRYNSAISLLDFEGKDTLWETIFFQESEMKEIYQALTKIYALLNADGDSEILEHLTVDRIDHCTFGNSQPFRIRIINRINDNYDHFYVKKADASRIYGLELEEILSPDSVSYLLDRNTLIEAHIAGIPGDEFFAKHLDDSIFNQIRVAKEFVKFNERCFVRLLGDMRSYNFVVDITPDIEGSQFRLRAIDFDQQSYEGRKSFYLPQYFKDNNPIIFLGIKHMKMETVRQYQLEERSLIAVRLKNSRTRANRLLKIMAKDDLSSEEKVTQLKHDLIKHHNNQIFEKCHTMGEILITNLQLLLAKDFKQSIVFED